MLIPKRLSPHDDFTKVEICNWTAGFTSSYRNVEHATAYFSVLCARRSLVWQEGVKKQNCGSDASKATFARCLTTILIKAVIFIWKCGIPWNRTPPVSHSVWYFFLGGCAALLLQHKSSSSMCVRQPAESFNETSMKFQTNQLTILVFNEWVNIYVYVI